ncbi:MAG: hypothetical protein KAT11_01580 [Phycisphaerae bacterium]|nr:hypothetical protein [Phycisphaerae bacterium]
MGVKAARRLADPPTVGLGEWVGTNFEHKYLAQGRTIYSRTARKISGP